MALLNIRVAPGPETAPGEREKLLSSFRSPEPPHPAYTPSPKHAPSTENTVALASFALTGTGTLQSIMKAIFRGERIAFEALTDAGYDSQPHVSPH